MVYFIISTTKNTAPNDVVANIVKNFDIPFKIAYVRTSSESIFQDYDPIHIKNLKTNKDDILFLNDLIALNAAKKLKGIKIPIVHSDLKEEYAQIADSFFKKIKVLIRKAYHEYLLKTSYLCIGVSEPVYNYIKSIEAKGTYVDNGIDYNKIDQLPSLKKKPNSDVIHLAQTGHLSKGKNILESIELIRKLKDQGINVRLHLFGNPANNFYLNLIFKKMQELSLEKNKDVVFYGFVTKEELFEKYQEMDCFLMLSKAEGLSLALLESFGFGLYPIVSNIPAMSSVIHKMGKGTILDDERSFNKLVSDLKDRKYKNTKEEIKRKASILYSDKRMSNEYLNIIKEVKHEHNVAD